MGQGGRAGPAATHLGDCHYTLSLAFSMGPDQLPPTPQAQLVASQLQAELEKLRCTSALGSSEVEEAAQLKVLGAITPRSLLSLEAPWAQSTLV